MLPSLDYAPLFGFDWLKSSTHTASLSSYGMSMWPQSGCVQKMGERDPFGLWLGSLDEHTTMEMVTTKPFIVLFKYCVYLVETVSRSLLDITGERRRNRG